MKARKKRTRRSEEEGRRDKQSELSRGISGKEEEQMDEAKFNPVHKSRRCHYSTVDNINGARIWAFLAGIKARMGQWSASLTQNSLACRFMHARSSNAFGHAENADQSRKTNERTEESSLGPLPPTLSSASNKNEAKIDGFCSGRCFSEIGKTAEGRE